MAILDSINSPEDLKKLDILQLEELADEIRKKIIETVSENGGHMASNLGITDLTIALHRVFSCPGDSLLFDVGHQAYAHKLLTGRRDSFGTLRRFGGLSGFTNRSESDYDTVTSGHSGSALSAAIGIAEANKLTGSDAWSIAVIGDGSFTNGMVYEAIEQLHSKDLRIMIILNDNGMSISENVGGVSDHFAKIRTSEKYFSFKSALKKGFKKIPGIGNALISGSYAVKEFTKRFVGAETIFEMFGLEYLGPVDGNDIKKLISVLEEAAGARQPIIVHVRTVKGLGYAPAEKNPEKFHNISPAVSESARDSFRQRVSGEILRLAEKRNDLACITAAMGNGCGLDEFAVRYPERFFDVGIAEEHAVSFAAGLALGGRILPALFIYSTFLQRTFDQLWHDIGLQTACGKPMHVMMFVSHCGFVPGDGTTHQGLYDIPLLSMVKGVTVYSPDDYASLGRSVDDAADGDGLTVIRYPKGPENIYDVGFDDMGLWKRYGSGGTVVVTYGRVARNVIKGCRGSSHGDGITVAVLRRIIPLPDDNDFRDLLENAERIFVVEETIENGSIGEKIASSGYGAKVFIRAFKGGETAHGSIEELYGKYGFDSGSIASWIDGSF